MEKAYGREWRNGMMWRGSLVSIAFWHQVMFLHFTFTSSSWNIIKICVNNHGMERQKERGEESSWRRLPLWEHFFFLRIVREGERERGWLKKKKFHKLWKSSSFSPLAEEHMWGAGVRASCGREELVLQHRELLPPQVIQKHYSSVLRTRDGWRHAQARNIQSKDMITHHRVTWVRCLTDLNHNADEDQRSGRSWSTTTSECSRVFLQN